MPTVGELAPDFTLQDQSGESVTLSDFRGAPIVLYFYPKDDTSGCTAQACQFRDTEADYSRLGTPVIGVSPDSVKSHQKFAEKYSLPFKLLADPEHTVCELYGVWKEKSLYGKKYMGVERTTFILDKGGVIHHRFTKVAVPGHTDEVLRVLRSME